MFDIQTNINLKKGNPATFKDVFALLYPRMKGYCKLFFTSDDLVDDIIQETFITLWEKRNDIRTDKAIESYIFVMLRNKCLNVLKKQKLENPNIDIESLDTEQLQYLYQLDFLGKEERSLEEELIVAFQKAIDTLPTKMKTVFVMSKLEGRKQKEIAEELDISLKMVEKHMAKAKQHIREKLIHQFPTLLVLISFLID